MEVLMRKIVFGSLSLLIISNVAAACPNMAGTWVCHSSAEEKATTTVVTQENIPNGVLYHLAGDDGRTYHWQADGLVHPVTGEYLSGTMQLTCQGDQSLTLREDLADSKGSLNATVDARYSLEGENSLVWNSTAVFQYSGEPTNTQSVTGRCSRN
jgi:hypothetical protein